jgi:hypothetical protein
MVSESSNATTLAGMKTRKSRITRGAYGSYCAYECSTLILSANDIKTLPDRGLLVTTVPGKFLNLFGIKVLPSLAVVL